MTASEPPEGTPPYGADEAVGDLLAAARELVVGTDVRAPKTSELVASRIRDLIVSGELAPGDRLPPEVDLMAQFGVSRPTMREAIRVLESEGLVDVRRGSHGGAVVQTPSSAVPGRQLAVLLAYLGVEAAEVSEAVAAVEQAAHAAARCGAGRKALDAVADVLRHAAGLTGAASRASTPGRPLTPAHLTTGGATTVTRGEPAASNGDAGGAT